MKITRNPFKIIYILWLLITVTGIFFLIYPLVRYALAKPERYPLGHKLRVFWGKALLFFGLVRLKTEFEQPVDPKGVYIITPNHSSYIDIATITTGLDMLDFSFMAKAELLNIPLFGIWFKTIDIAVDRKNARKAAEAYIKATRFFSSGRSLVIFPEGTIGPQIPKLLRFKDGPFKLAVEKQVDILPVTIIDNYKIFNDTGVISGRPGKVYQYIHAPISTKGMTQEDVEGLKNKVYQIIEAKLKEYGN
ncbi:MAG: 1-acyl-sn-glycerol-3-phosphate acyltransferase [Bacteroidia bacterium]|nr:1-acyl-sn-glycerol-3-phosphate acyltransferase [Bacteroidia bacterium]